METDRTIKRMKSAIELQEETDAELARRLQLQYDEEIHAQPHPSEHSQLQTFPPQKSMPWVQGAQAEGRKRKIDSVTTSHSASLSSVVPAWHLMRTRQLHGLPNQFSKSLTDIVTPGAEFAVICDYMYDMDWMIRAIPALLDIPSVIVIHGEKPGGRGRMTGSAASNMEMIYPTFAAGLDRFGTHHSKMMLLFYRRGVRVMIHTANMLSGDWNNKTQGMWTRDFPLKTSTQNWHAGDFENDLVDYMQHYGPRLAACVSRLRQHDFSNAGCALVASVPGYHSGGKLNKYGHLRMRELLRKEPWPSDVRMSAPLVCQYSSTGTVGQKWLDELKQSLTASEQLPQGSQAARLQLIWPTIDDVRGSLEGWAAGGSIPGDSKNIRAEHMRVLMHRWGGAVTGRERAMPHIKTFLRYDPLHPDHVVWMLLTSSNLSKAAWGAVQQPKGKPQQLCILSYELGVLFLPSLYRPDNGFCCTSATATVPLPLSQLSQQSSDKTGSTETAQRARVCFTTDREIAGTHPNLVLVPVPYALPPTPYGVGMSYPARGSVLICAVLLCA
eukprot:TRINITY_DN6455_c0_g1_i2.p1 TRINITY_DN6455_c0_g1~~TRINITY_DN6455_c0_g1_i2.p1  ORF type:complete len:554 (+),score=84.90 TRINITY_DN6455_c0_g1_i2:34-1695(+)